MGEADVSDQVSCLLANLDAILGGGGLMDIAWAAREENNEDARFAEAAFLTASRQALADFDALLLDEQADPRFDYARRFLDTLRRVDRDAAERKPS